MPEHLAQGSTEPPITPGLLRLYGMRFCPFDHRVHLVMNAKNIPHDVVFLNLKNKPDWYLERIASTKVPGLLVDGQVLYESLIIADFLDEKYPERPLYSKDPLKKAKDRILIESFGKVTALNYRLLTPTPTINEFDVLVAALANFDEELAERGTTFFSGDEPGMVDYMIWPWFERIGALKILFGDQFDFPEGKLKHLISWMEAMKEDTAVKKYCLSPEIYAEYLKGYVVGKPNFSIPV